MLHTAFSYSFLTAEQYFIVYMYPIFFMHSSVRPSVFPSISYWTEVKVKAAQLCLTLCNPMDCIVQELLQARILEWVAFPFSRGSSQPRDKTQVSWIVGQFFTS